VSARRAARAGSDLPTIKVSEIGEYAYCSRAWWYKHVAKVPIPQGAASGRLAAGTQAHHRHGAWVASSLRLRAIGLALALCGLVSLLIALFSR
jgi:CRISPR/Cas system-associated exonuclease Cas4 (RecB family)